MPISVQNYFCLKHLPSYVVVIVKKYVHSPREKFPTDGSWDESHDFKIELWDRKAVSCPVLAVVISSTLLHKHRSSTFDS